jgi:hypothetical protein
MQSQPVLKNDGKYYFASLSHIFASKKVIINRAEHLKLEEDLRRELVVQHLQIDKTNERRDY